MNRRITMRVMTLGLLLGLARVSHGQAVEDCTTVSFTQPAGSPVRAEDQPNSVAVGDFNLDGRPDLAVANYGSNDVTILLGDGLGGFTQLSNSPVGVGHSPISVAVGDFGNLDGKPDLAVANHNSHDVTILLGDGLGGFTQFSNSPVDVGAGPRSVAVGDFDLDGRPDLAVANDSDNVTILLGGVGGFTEPSGSPVSVGNAPFSVVVGGDFNFDGRPDLAVANSDSNNVTILLGDGMGGFIQPSGSPVGVGGSPVSVAVGDFNFDGSPDLAVANLVDDNVTILLSNWIGGFTQPSSSPVGGGGSPVSVAVGDFRNLRGSADLAVVNGGDNNVTILLTAVGGFTEPGSSPVGVGVSPVSVAVGDFNLDGRPDLAVANGGDHTVTILLTTCSNAPPTDTLPLVITLRPADEESKPARTKH